MKNNSLVSFLIIIILILLFALYSCFNRVKDLEQVASAQGDSIHRMIDENGKETASRQVYLTTIDNMKKVNDSQDSLIVYLKEKLNKNTASLTVVTTKTKTEHATKTEVSFRTDSDSIGIRRNEAMGTSHEGINDSILSTVTFKSSYSDQWCSYDIVAMADTIKLNYTGFNQFSVSQEWKKQKGLKGFFQPPILEISITNENPNTKTTGVESFHAQIPKGHNLRVFGIGVGIGVTAILLLK